MTPKLASTLLRLNGIGFIIFCTVFVTIAFPGYDGFALHIADLFDWTGEPYTETMSRDARWFGAIWSGLGAGFGALYLWVVAPLLTLPNRDAQNIAKRGGLIAVSIWFVVDSIGSYAAGVPSNVAMNFIFTVLIATPLVLAKFDKRENSKS